MKSAVQIFDWHFIQLIGSAYTETYNKSSLSGKLLKENYDQRKDC